MSQRPAQLREDLALGSGPTIARLAEYEGVDQAVLGRALRTNRVNFAPKTDDATAWAPSFLRRVDDLVDFVILARQPASASAHECRGPTNASE